MKIEIFRTRVPRPISLLVFFGTLLGLLSVLSCTKENVASLSWPEGIYSQSKMQELSGFFEQRADLLRSESMTLEEFKVFSTDSAWHLNETERLRLKSFREEINFPSSPTLLQKIIALEDVGLYMNNTYGGTVGGFISSAGDVKSLKTLSDMYNGLRLDYPGTKFSPGGGGYAVIRYTSNVTDHLMIPYCVEMGGTRVHAWPNTGGGFTASTLGNGGFPEYSFDGYYAPNQGGELYEVTPAGNEILRARHNGTRWITVEPETRGIPPTPIENPIRNGIYARTPTGEIRSVIPLPGGEWKLSGDEESPSTRIGTLVSVRTYGEYKGIIFQIRGYDGKNYHLVTTDPNAQKNIALQVIEKGIYGITVPVSEVSHLREIITE